MARDQLIAKVYRCIDETYPDTTQQDMEEFNIPAFLDEAVRWVAQTAPTNAFGEGEDKSDATITSGGNISVGDNFLRLLEIKLSSWKVSVIDASSQNSPRYRQQQNPALRGGVSRPIVFLVKGDTELEVHPNNGTIEVLRTFEMEKGNDGYYTTTAYTKYPDKLLDITAWKTAELIFSTMQDANGVSVAQAQIQLILQTL